MLGFFAALSLLDAPTVTALRRRPTPPEDETPAADELLLEPPALAFLLLASSAYSVRLIVIFPFRIRPKLSSVVSERLTPVS